MRRLGRSAEMELKYLKQDPGGVFDLWDKGALDNILFTFGARLIQENILELPWNPNEKLDSLDGIEKYITKTLSRPVIARQTLLGNMIRTCCVDEFAKTIVKEFKIVEPERFDSSVSLADNLRHSVFYFFHERGYEQIRELSHNTTYDILTFLAAKETVERSRFRNNKFMIFFYQWVEGIILHL